MDKVCTFQAEKEINLKLHLLKANETKNIFACALSVAGSYADYWVEYDPDTCPMYKTWQILKVNRK
jgi:hypothetical protein